MADQTAAAKAARAEDQKAVEKSRAEYNERMRGRPTPTQEECDLIKLGAPLPNKSESGAGPDPRVTRHMEASPSGGSATYSTRASRGSSSSSHASSTGATGNS
jgi:hypothetical protein